MGADPKSWAEKFVAELTVGGERVPFERVLAHHFDEVAKLRSISGLTWRSMASLLVRAGARRADGSPISADQLRVGYARLVRHAEKPASKPSRKTGPRSTRRGVVQPVSAGLSEASRPHRAAVLPAAVKNASSRPAKSSAAEDVSDEEIALALTRLTKLPSKP